MELHQLRTFLAVAETGHLTRAAERLFTSQPAVSTQLKSLEEELGVKLFERTSRGMNLTPAGENLRPLADQIVTAARRFKHDAEGLRNSVSGELVLGLNNRPEFLRVVPLLARLAKAHPDLRYELVNGSSGVIVQGLAEGSITVGFFEGACENRLIRSHRLADTELLMVAPKAWQEEFSRPDWKALESKPWIFVSPQCSYFRVVESFCREQGLNLQRRFKVNEDLTVLNLVAEELGMTIAARAQVESHPLRDRLITLPHFRASVPLSIGYLATRSDEPSIAAVRKAVLEIWQAAEPANRECLADPRPASGKTAGSRLRTKDRRIELEGGNGSSSANN
ncbi:MAG TPA: hypothetical protein DCY13_15915 [Verrucomicrobiales bacterium]|nr:hypothetical protein [Verrucomicrobiales bacterium]